MPNGNELIECPTHVHWLSLKPVVIGVDIFDKKLTLDKYLNLHFHLDDRLIAHHIVQLKNFTYIFGSTLKYLQK